MAEEKEKKGVFWWLANHRDTGQTICVMLLCALIMLVIFYGAYENNAGIDEGYKKGYEEAYAVAEEEYKALYEDKLMDAKNEAYNTGYNLAKEMFASNYNSDTSDGKQNYVVNKSSKKFHKPGCEWAGKIASYNRQDVKCNRQDLIDKGYEPCKVCCP